MTHNARHQRARESQPRRIWCPSSRMSPTVFVKTIILSRKATKQYLGEESDHED